MSTAFLVLSIIGLLFTLNAFRPIRLEIFSIFTFFAGWLTSELPIHHLVWQVVATAAFVAAGALEHVRGWIGLGLTVVSWCGLVWLARQADRAEAVLEVALIDGLGSGYRSRMDPSLTREGDGREQWRRLVLPFRRRDPEVEAVRDIPYVEGGGRRNRLDIYRRRDHPVGRPVLLYIHGGGWVIGEKREQGIPMMLHLAARGWVCVTANYPLSPKATFPDHLVAVKRALVWVKEHIAEYGGDPSYVAVSGGSAGGHLAALVALTSGDATLQPGFEEADTSVQAAVPFYGVYDFTNRHGIRRFGMGRFLEKTVMKTRLADDPEGWAKASPMDQVREDAPPFFVVHGANDTLVPVQEARHFVKLLRDAGTEPVAYAELPGAQHAFEVFRSIRTAHAVRAVERFLAFAHQRWLSDQDRSEQVEGATH